MRSSDRTIANGTASRWPLRFAAVVFAAMVATVPAQAQDLGVIGPVYPIAEPNLLEVILGKLRAAGEGRHARPSATRVAGKGQARRRRPGAGGRLSRTRQPRRFHHDPSIVVQEAIRDADGRVIVPPGTVGQSARHRDARARRCSSSTRAIASRSRVHASSSTSARAR